MGAYIVKCNEIVKDENGKVVEIRCTADLESGCGNPVDGRKVKGTIHWLSADHCYDANVMIYDKLFTIPNITEMPQEEYNNYLNADSLRKIESCKVEPALAEAAPGEKFQFVRNGYYCKDTKNPNTFNKIVGLKDSFPKNV